MAWRHWTRNAGAKILSFVIAVGVWFMVTNQIEFEKTMSFPVEYVNHPADLTTIDPLPATIRARVRGKGKFLRYTLRDGVCRVDLKGYQMGRSQLLFSGQDVVFPDDVTVSRVDQVEPWRAVVEFDETVIRDVAITPTVVGSPDPRYMQVGKTFLSPAKARVKGPRSLVDPITLLPTREIDIDEKKSTIRKPVRLRTPESETVEVTPMVVEVGITIEPIIVERIERVALETMNGGSDSGSIVILPAVATVEIQGARSIVEVAVREVTSLVLHTDRWEPGVYQLRFEGFREWDIVMTLARQLEMPAPEETEETEGAEATGEGDAATAEGAPVEPEEEPEPQFEEIGREIIARLPLPREVELLGLAPATFVVEVLTAEQVLARSSPPDSTQ